MIVLLNWWEKVHHLTNLSILKWGPSSWMGSSMYHHVKNRFINVSCPNWWAYWWRVKRSLIWCECAVWCHLPRVQASSSGHLHLLEARVRKEQSVSVHCRPDCDNANSRSIVRGVLAWILISRHSSFVLKALFLVQQAWRSGQAKMTGDIGLTSNLACGRVPLPMEGPDRWAILAYVKNRWGSTICQVHMNLCRFLLHSMQLTVPAKKTSSKFYFPLCIGWFTCYYIGAKEN